MLRRATGPVGPRRSRVLLGRRARADQVPVAGGLVDPADRRPVLVLAEAGERVRRRLCGCTAGPIRRPYRRRGVRRPPQGRRRRGPGAGRDLGDLPADRDHRRAEPVELGQVLALGRLDHERPRGRGRRGSARGSRS